MSPVATSLKKLHSLPCHFPLPLHFLLTSFFFFFLSPATAQIGTQLQEITTHPSFFLQKDCAIDCFGRGGICTRDMLGEAIGCAIPRCDKTDRGWAMNDCYCRPDLQAAAQSALTSCVRRGCTEGDYAVDASTAGSLYAQYCREKGYAPLAAPASVDAAATGTLVGGGPGGFVTYVTSGGTPLPTGTAAAEEGEESSGGIDLGKGLGLGLGGLGVFGVIITILLCCCGCCG